MIEITRILRQRLILHRAVLVILIMRYARKVKLVFIYSALRIYVKCKKALLSGFLRISVQHKVHRDKGSRHKDSRIGEECQISDTMQEAACDDV